MPSKRFAKKHWKMVVVLIAICAAMLLLRWAAMLGGERNDSTLRMLIHNVSRLIRMGDYTLTKIKH